MEYRHFSHRHLLVPLHCDDDDHESEKIIKCKVCERVIIPNDEPSHGCYSCKHFLHDHCLNLPRWLQHPSHHSHPLTLVPSPTYPDRSYSCNACGSLGSSFSFSCAKCEFDLHTHCANLPATILIDAHPHQLRLTFEYNGDLFIVCDVCGGPVDKRFWAYKCVDCGFDCHLACVRPDQRAELTQNQPELTQVVDGSPRANDALDPMRQAANQMMQDQLEMMRLQNQLNRTRMMANVMTWAYRPH